MTYNIHPLLVHFPIAMLFLYSVIKIIPFRKWFTKISWKHIELALLLVGVLGAFAALATGDTAEHFAHASRQLVRVHSTFADVATFIYCLLLFGEVLVFLTPVVIPKLKMSWLTALSLYVQKILTDPIFAAIFAILGLVAISVTGLLGGVIVYGVSADPFAAVVMNMLGITY